MQRTLTTIACLAALILPVVELGAAEDLGLIGAWNLYEKGQTDSAREKVLTAMYDAQQYLLASREEDEKLEPEGQRMVLNAMMNATGLSLTNERALRQEDRISDPEAQRSYVKRLITNMENYLASAETRDALTGMSESETERFEKKRERLLTASMELLPEAQSRRIYEDHREFLERRGIDLETALDRRVAAPEHKSSGDDAPKASIWHIIGYLMLITAVMAAFVLIQKMLHG